MRYMETKYGFKATQQMYKKRFAKWGTQKNSRRSTTLTLTPLTMEVSRKSSPSRNRCSVPISRQLSNNDSLVLLFLSSVQIWSVSFYESVDSASASIRQFPPELTEETNFTFKLVIDMLNSSQGSLAGRLARKAFLLLEEMVKFDGPALVWNMLEIIHHMVRCNHLQLFQGLLAHLVALVEGQMPKTHPLCAILQALRAFVPTPQSLRTTPSSSILNSSPPTVSPGGNEALPASGSSLFPSAFLFWVERAWTLNAEILFGHFDDRLFQLYSRIHWDSCSIEPPRAIVDATKQWLSHVTLRQISTATAEADQPAGDYQITSFDEDGMLQHQSAPPVKTSPPRDYNKLRASSVGALRHHAENILRRSATSPGDAATLLPILAGLVTAKVLGEWPAATDLLGTGIEVRARISRGQATIVACALRTSMDLNAEYDRFEAPLDTVGRMRSVVALREYANAETDPRLIRELWLLADALVAAGEHRKAFDVRQTVYRRLEEYVQDIPVNFA
ncbi:hypothetical protein LTR49_027929 [Elasticomyces elasticus]|nr:hypothetical protein LTR49_027929 [Elasticomyces elasticus]KAK5731545.1 hypothetical protein LTS12_027251 [Elasticomyces elasticus]